MKKILCLTDFSAASDKAVQYAAWVAQRCGATLTLLHAVQMHLLDNEEAVALNNQSVEAQVHMAERALHDTCSKLQEQFKGDDKKHPLPCTFLVKEGLLYETVATLYEHGTFDFIIMGTTGGGADKLEDLILGSNTVRVIEKIPCPVLAVPIGAHNFRLEKIVFATSYHERDFDAIKMIVPIAQCFNSQIFIVHVCPDDSKEQQEKFDSFCRPLAQHINYDRLHFNRISHTDPEEGLLTFVEQMRGDMIAMLAKEQGIFRRFFHQSMIEVVAYQSKVPFLVMHEDALDS